MKRSRRLIVTAAVLVLTMGTGCGKSGKPPRTSLAPSPLAPGAAPVGSVGPIVPTLVPQSGDPGTPAHNPQPSKSPPTSKPPRSGPRPSSSPAAPPPPVHNDFSIATTGNCFWSILYNAGENDLMVAAEFTFSYRGDQTSVTSAPFTLTANPSDGYHSDGDVPLGTHLEETGGHSYQSSPFLGQQITVTGTLTVTDDITSDNAASITVSMPTLAQVQSVGLTPSTPHPTTCG